MDFSSILEIGKTHINEYIVKEEDTADSIGNTGVVMLSTPSMIKFMENTSSHLVIDNLPKNYRAVGIQINVKHINATPVNAKVTVKSTLISIDGKKLRYSVEAFNEKCKIGFGTYEQYIVDLERFLNKN